MIGVRLWFALVWLASLVATSVIADHRWHDKPPAYNAANVVNVVAGVVLFVLLAVDAARELRAWWRVPRR